MGEDAATWLSRYLGEDDFVRINGVVVSVLPDRSIGLADLIGAWSEHLLKLESDLLAAMDDRSTWGAHDYVAALVIRDLIVQGVALAGLDLRSRIERVVAELDQRFIDFSEPDKEGYTERIDGIVKMDRGWWWHRIPKNGPVREEMLAHYGHSSSS